jgi:hypothetical protein
MIQITLGGVQVEDGLGEARIKRLNRLLGTLKPSLCKI